MAGELALTALVIVAFSHRMPDRLRWDFFRFLVLPPAVLAWVSSTRLWLGVARGTQPLPLGSILGSPGDLSGDLDRLIGVYGLSSAVLTRGYLWLSFGTAALVLGNYLIFARRALRTAKERA